MSPPQEEEEVSDSIESSVIRVSRAAAAESSGIVRRARDYFAHANLRRNSPRKDVNYWKLRTMRSQPCVITLVSFECEITSDNNSRVRIIDRPPAVLLHKELFLARKMFKSLCSYDLNIRLC